MTAPPGGYGPRPGFDDERTPVAPHARPAPVVVRSGEAAKGPPPLPPRGAPRAPTPKGGTLAAARFPSEPPTSPRGTPHLAARLVRNWAACSVEDQRLIEALAVRLRPGVGT